MAAFVAGVTMFAVSGAAFGMFISNVVVSTTVNTASVVGLQATATAVVTGTVNPGHDSLGSGSSNATITYTVTDGLSSTQTITGFSTAITSVAPTGCSNSDYTVTPITGLLPAALLTVQPTILTATISMPATGTDENACSGYALTVQATITGTNP